MWRVNEELALCWRAFIDLMFPRRCLVCGRYLETFEKYLCIGCNAEMPLTYFWSWRDNPAEKLLCQKVGISSATSLFFYQDCNNYSLLTQKVKYSGWLSFGRILGKKLAEKMLESKRFAGIELIVPVPLHRSRYWSRGYNQSEIIAGGAASVLGIQVVNLLKRIRNTVSQTTLSKEDKHKNVEGAFLPISSRINEAKQQGIKHVLLIDDVLTSGSTLSACASILIKDFEVSVATVAFVGEL